MNLVYGYKKVTLTAKINFALSLRSNFLLVSITRHVAAVPKLYNPLSRFLKLLKSISHIISLKSV